MSKKRQATVGRTLHFLDVENLAGEPAPTARALAEVALAVTAVSPARAGDLIVVGASSGGTALDSGLVWRGARLVHRRGSNGADLALIDAADPSFIADRFDKVVIGSGDGIFADHVSSVARLGVRVIVVTRHDALARRLRLAAHEVRFIDTTTEPAVARMEVRRAG